MAVLESRGRCKPFEEASPHTNGLHDSDQAHGKDPDLCGQWVHDLISNTLTVGYDVGVYRENANLVKGVI